LPPFCLHSDLLRFFLLLLLIIIITSLLLLFQEENEKVLSKRSPRGRWKTVGCGVDSFQKTKRWGFARTTRGQFEGAFCERTTSGARTGRAAVWRAVPHDWRAGLAWRAVAHDRRAGLAWRAAARWVAVRRTWTPPSRSKRCSPRPRVASARSSRAPDHLRSQRPDHTPAQADESAAAQGHGAE